MNRMKVMTVVGTRPEIIRLSRVMARLDAHTDHVLVHTGQNYDYELNQVFFDDLGLRRPDHFLEVAGGTAAETIGRVIIEVDTVLERERPDAMLILGDTNSCLAVIPAKRRRIPVFHMEAGNRCFDMRVPEEINRRIVDHTADINLPYSDIARDYLLAEGLPADRIVKTGSPMFEVLNHYRTGIEASDILARQELVPGEYFLVSAHREENVDAEPQLRRLHETLNAIAERFDRPILVSTHPRTRKRIDAHGLIFDPRVRLLKPFGFLDYNALQMNARAVLSDSGTISEEASILRFPALNIREAHERPEAMEEGAVMMVGLGRDRVLQALDILATEGRGDARGLRPVADYSMPNVSDKVLRIIVSYTDYVKRTVWKAYAG
ncbi:non-hydrolyzing UDP-N-acetylglucosamine 2-epimerase [Sphingomonas endophytica]|uniref:UDP-N-acetylglucosamine 2-epimerase n=1 Tax=Sphingomonas endophytica TaxID=869719 RepID=A0A147I111_9SPHN|nr:UDP-N-acetylglucosamine 2-epimerase (non-hydrolyzing) [Sphingomonas endophytica]KTT71180.1 UDP-N-acetylglucosamine 2-epimerase [Sphingomonas endophytica]